jgi:hypothetical protein
MIRDSRIQEKASLSATKNRVARNLRRSKKRTVARSVIARLPSRNAAEVPTLLILSGAPSGAMPTKAVLHELRCGKWFSELKPEDKEVVYEKSRKNVLDTILKFSKKALVVKKQVFPVREASEVGVWKITESGIERARKEGADWRATYSQHHAIELDFEDPPSSGP